MMILAANKEDTEFNLEEIKSELKSLNYLIAIAICVGVHYVQENSVRELIEGLDSFFKDAEAADKEALENYTSRNQ